MAVHFIPPIGARFNRLVTLALPSKDDDGYYRVPCRCDCGVEKRVHSFLLSSGRAKTCGQCPKVGTERMKKAVGDANRKHGAHGTPEYGAWSAMKKRCLNPRHKAYARYGGRGIDIDPRWVASFEAFISDMGARPEGLTLERKDNDRGYWPDNCVWADRSAQNKNRRPFEIVRHGQVIQMHKAQR